MENNKNEISFKQNLLKNRFILIAAVFSMLPLFFITESAITVFTQEKNKKEKEITRIAFENEPIEFTKVESDQKTVKLNEKFDQEGDWLKGLTIKFKNISAQPIVYVSIVVDFPETESTGKLMLYFLNYGTHLYAPAMPNDKKELLSPGSTAEVKLSSKDYSILKNFLSQRHLLSDLTKANFRIMTVHFVNGTIWTAGTISRPDPDRPGKFIPVDKKNQEKEK